jgi:DNA-binding NarL/FixJ family response regulator
MIKQGFDEFCRENSRFEVTSTYPGMESILRDHFDPQADLLLICHECVRPSLAEPGPHLSRLALLFPGARPVMINSELNRDEKIELVTRGVKGFLSKEARTEDMKKAFKAILAGEIWISRRITEGVLNELIQQQSALNYTKPGNRFHLSKRESEILQAIASGLSNYEIGEKLFISEKTVKAHIHHIFKKMGVRNRTQAVLKSMEYNPD